MDSQIIQILEMIAAVIAAIVAYWQNVQKRDAVQAKKETEDMAHVANILKSEAEADKADVVSFFDPADDTVTKPPESVPARSWKMSDETKHWIIFDHPPDEQAALLKQIAEAEEAKKSSYIISVPGCYYEIEYGLLKGGGKGKK